MRKLDGYDNGNGASTKNPITIKQRAILNALSYYFDIKFTCRNAKEAFDAIGNYKNRITILRDEIRIDGHLIYTRNGLHPNAKKYNE